MQSPSHAKTETGLAKRIIGKVNRSIRISGGNVEMYAGQKRPRSSVIARCRRNANMDYSRLAWKESLVIIKACQKKVN
jgi:hypothetical protein